MRYNLESTLPINAFSPRVGRGPFARGMTLEGGGGGGGVLGGVGKAVGSVFKGASDVVKGVVQPIYNATLKNIPGVDKALVGLDKTVGKSIPGGWGTVAAMAVPFIPGAAFLPGGTLGSLGITKTGLATGLGALSGSGVMRKGNEFNLQGAILGGAMAYGGAQLAEGLQAAGAPGVNQAAEQALASDTARIAANLGVEGAGTGAGSQAAMLANQTAGLEAIPRGLADAIPKGAANLQAANVGISNLASNPDVFAGLSGTQPIIPQPSGLSNLASTGSETLSNLGQAGQGIKNLTGFGPQGISGISEAASAFAKPVTQTGLVAGVIGTSGLMAMEEQKKLLDQQLAQGSIAQDEYNQALAEIQRQAQIGRDVVAANPFKTDTDVSGSLSGSGQDSPKSYETLYANAPSSAATLYENKPYASGGKVQQYGLASYAMGGQVDPELGGDYTAIGMDQGNMRRGLFGLGYAAGGTARFLSGGGDGMSDSIPARINGTQEARLADGEFVIPADVVSHLGNGSSKAGAKQLYAMMDKVRQARTGRKSQGKQINPRKYMPA